MKTNTILPIIAVSILSQFQCSAQLITRGGNGGLGGEMSAFAATQFGGSDSDQTSVATLPSGEFIVVSDNPSGGGNDPSEATGNVKWSDELLQTSVTGSIFVKGIMSGSIVGSQASASGGYQYAISLISPTTFHFEISAAIVHTAGNTGEVNFDAYLDNDFSGMRFMEYFSGTDGATFESNILLDAGNYTLTVGGNANSDAVGEANGGVNFTASVPEPSSYTLLSLGAIGVVALYVSRRKAGKLTNMKSTSTILALACATFLSGCANCEKPKEKITLNQAVEASVDALILADQRAKDSKTTWGLLPSEVTLTYNISDEVTKAASITGSGSAAPTPASLVTLSGTRSVTKQAISGNTIVMKFTRGGR